MSFPVWAPADLTEEFSRLETEADNCRNRDAEAKSEAFIDDQLSPEDNYWKEQAAKKDDLANILFKLLTHQDMHAVWKTLSRPAVNPRYDEHGEYILWSWISRTLEDFPLLMALSQTPAQKMKSQA